MIQLGALWLAAARIPLAAGYPEPAEFQAIRVLLAAQFVGAAMFFPLLCRGWQMTVLTLVTGWVMLTFAGALAATPAVQLVAPAGSLALWILTLSLAGLGIRGHGARTRLTAAATCVVAGGPIVWYAANDMGSAPVSSAAADFAFGPLWLVLQNPSHPPAATWWELSTACVLALVFGAIATRFGRRIPHTGVAGV